MKKHTFRIAAVILCAVLCLLCFASCGDNRPEAAMEYKDSDGNVTAYVDRNFVSFFIAMSNYQNGVDGVDYWNEKIQDDSDTTFKDLYIRGIEESIGAYLKAEYLGDHVFGIGFDEKQQDSVEKTIDEMIAAKGSEKALESYLSAYGASIESVKRFMVLWSKYNTLRTGLYIDESPYAITQDDIKSYFADNYSIADHVSISLTGGIKDDGTTIPLSQDELEQKKALAKQVFNEVNSGAIDFETAVSTYNEDGYKTAYPKGYFVPDKGSVGLDTAVEDKIRAMAEGETAMVETAHSVYIVKKQPMDAELYKTVEGFGDNLKNILENEDFEKQLEKADGVVVYGDIISQLDPSVIPALNIDTLYQ